jgi:hypothetical protein
MTPTDYLTIGMAVVGVVAVVSPYVAGLPWVKARPGLSNFIIGAGLAAGRLKQAIPAGTTAAQAQVLIENEAAKVAANYSDSIKAAGLTQAQVISTIEGLTKGQLPAGHIVADALPLVVAVEPQIQAVIAQLSELLAKHAPAGPAPEPPAVPVVAPIATPTPALVTA